jgi:hypothetical protein
MCVFLQKAQETHSFLRKRTFLRKYAMV